MADKPPMFNSKLLKVYLEYIDDAFPHLDYQSVFEYSGISPLEIDESGHWFDEDQVDRFYYHLVELTGNKKLARDVGRYAFSTRTMRTSKKLVIGLMNTAAIYMQVESNYEKLSKGARVRTRKVGANQVEIITRPAKGLTERPYMCQNRIGILESLAVVFTGRYAEVEEISCLHSGSDCCRYLISWDEADFWRWKRFAHIAFLSTLVLSFLLFWVLPLSVWGVLTGGCAFLSLFLLMYAGRLEREELLNIMKVEGDAATELLDEMEFRYRNSIMVKEIGQSISTILQVDRLLPAVMASIKVHLDYACGAIFVHDAERLQLTYSTSFGCNQDIKELIERVTFSISNPGIDEPFIRAYKERVPLLVNNTAAWNEASVVLRERLIQTYGVESFICVPIICKNASMGLLFAANPQSGRDLTMSDLSLLSGVASEIAVSMINGISFQKLKESEERYKLLAENINDVIWKTDLDLNTRYISPSCRKLTGFTQAEIKDLPIERIIKPESVRQIRELVRKHLLILEDKPSENCSIKQEVEYFCKDGSTVWTEVDASFQWDQDDQPVGLLGVSRNISDRKQAEVEKQRLEDQLRQAQKMEAIGTMAGGIAHDFNNILGIIMGNAELALEDLARTNPLHSQLLEVKQASLRGKEVVMQLLNFARQTPQEKQHLDLGAIIHESLDLLKVTIPSSIRIKRRIPDERIYIMADPIQIHQVVINMGTNAAQVMNETGGTLTIGLAVSDHLPSVLSEQTNLPPKGRYSVLTVSDTGSGIPQEILGRIFDPYFTTKSLGKGSGMGLAVVHGIVQNIGGEIGVSSRIGEGATFTICLPVVSARQVKPVTKRNPYAQTGHERILLVDDEAQIARLNQKLLTKMGYRVTMKTNPLEVIREFKAHPDGYHLVITDMAMPDLTGDRLAQKLLEIRKDIPIIICTGFNDRIDSEIARDMGIRAFMLKPIERDELAGTVRKVLDERVD